VPIPGAGIYVSPEAGVVVTGHGESCIDRLLSLEVHDAVLEADDPGDALRDILGSFPAVVPIGILALTQSFWVAGANTTLPWAVEVLPG
jgi:isoaspartyl peptidase/L-asparaginase-like protein (Ntn-hydrolase superfamily)